MAFYQLETLLRLYDGYRRSFFIAGHSLLLIQEDNRRYLLLNQCPHQQAPLDKGSIRQGYLQCPIHGMQFNLDTGATSDGCAARLQFLPIVYDGNKLGVEFN